MKEGAGGFNFCDAASDESLREEGRQVEGRERRGVHMRGIEPASHGSSIMFQVSGVKFQVSGVRCQVPGVRCQVPGTIEINVVLIKAYNAVE